MTVSAQVPLSRSDAAGVRVSHYKHLLCALRDRAAELGITYDTVDDICGFPLRYTAKLLSDPPVKHMSVYSMFTIMSALALAPELHHDAESLEKLQKRAAWIKYRRNGARYRPKMHSKGVHRPIRIELSPDLMRISRVKGGENSRKYLSKTKRRQLARKAALVRWNDVKAAAQSDALSKCEKGGTARAARK